MRRVFVAAAVIACACSGPAEQSEPAEEPEDGENETFVQDGKSDVNGVEDFGFEAECVIRLANGADRDTLDDDVGLFGHSATKMVEAREKKPFETLKEIDDVPFVGFISFNRMVDYARENGFCPGLNEEYVQAGEEEAIETIGLIFEEVLKEKYPPGERMRRDAHAKPHGCVKGFLRVENDELPPEMKVGIFSENTREYPVWIRYSNGDFRFRHDGEGDGRGMAIKVMGVEGEKLLAEERNAQTQDFLMINHPVFAVRNVIDYVDFSSAAADADPLTFLIEFVLSLDPTDVKFKELLIALDITKIKIGNPLFTRYFSMTPYLLGDTAIKFSATPCVPRDVPVPDEPENFLREAMVETLANETVCFDFGVQKQLDPETMPIEDPTVEWDESESPFLHAANIRIPQQEFDTPEQNEFCENLSFTPWHSLPEHRPIGGINRARKAVYQQISKLRHGHNSAPREEPTGHD